MLARMIQFTFFLLLATVLTGCGEVSVVEDVTHLQARKVVAELSRNGVSSYFEKLRRSNGKYHVVVSSGDFSESIRILDDNDLPEAPREEFLTSLTTSSFLPDSKEVEFLRLDHALAIQLEQLVENLPGVVNARAVVRYHSKDEVLSNENTAPSRAASLVVRTNETYSGDQADVRKIVSSIIPGLGDENLHISFHKSSSGGIDGVSHPNSKSVKPVTSFLFGFNVAKEDYRGLVLSLFGLMLLCAITCGLIGYWMSTMFFSPDVDDELQELKSTSLQLESRKREELPEVSI